MHALEHRVPPPVVAVLTSAGMWVLAHWWPLLKFEVPSRVLTGLAVATLGGLVSGAGVLEFKRAKTTVNPLHPARASSMVTTGIYRFTRNPMYVGITARLTRLLSRIRWGQRRCWPTSFRLVHQSLPNRA